MGLAPLIVVLKTLAIRTGNERYNQSARFWAKIFGINFALGVVTGIPMEFQFGTNWAHFALRRRRDRPNAGHGRRIRLLFGIRVSRFVPLRREAAEQVGTLDCRPAGSARLVDLGILHHRHRRLDAAPGGLFHRAERQRTAPELLGPGAEPVGVVAVRAQHERRHDHGLVCHGRAGRLVSAHTQA